MSAYLRRHSAWNLPLPERVTFETPVHVRERHLRRYAVVALLLASAGEAYCLWRYGCMVRWSYGDFATISGMYLIVSSWVKDLMWEAIG